MTQLVRVQVLLHNSQKRKLQGIANKEGRSVSEVLRELIDRGLEHRGKEKEDWRGALDRLNKIREASSAQGTYQGDIVAEVRAEREHQLESVWRKSS